MQPAMHPDCRTSSGVRVRPEIWRVISKPLSLWITSGADFQTTGLRDGKRLRCDGRCRAEDAPRTFAPHTLRRLSSQRNCDWRSPRRSAAPRSGRCPGSAFGCGGRDHAPAAARASATGPRRRAPHAFGLVNSRRSDRDLDRSPGTCRGIRVLAAHAGVPICSFVFRGGCQSMWPGVSDRIQEWKNRAIDLALGKVGDVALVPRGRTGLGLFLLIVGNQRECAPHGERPRTPTRRHTRWPR